MVSQEAMELNEFLDHDHNIARAEPNARSVSPLSRKDQASGLDEPELIRPSSPILRRSGHATQNTHGLASSPNNIYHKFSDSVKVPLVTSRSNESAEENAVRKSTTKRTVSVPWTLRRISLLALVAFLIALIVALEVLHSFSDKNQGLVTAKEDASYLWKYLPTASK